MYSLALAIGFSVTAAASEPASPSASADAQKPQTDLEAYEQFYRAAFRSSSIEKCVASAPKAAQAGFDIKPTCTCTTDRLLASNTLDQLVKFGAGEAQTDEIASITADCLKSNPPTRASNE